MDTSTRWARVSSWVKFRVCNHQSLRKLTAILAAAIRAIPLCIIGAWNFGRGFRGSHSAQYESELTHSPPARVMIAAKTPGLIVALRNLTEPSPKQVLDPPECVL